MVQPAWGADDPVGPSPLAKAPAGHVRFAKAPAGHVRLASARLRRRRRLLFNLRFYFLGAWRFATEPPACLPGALQRRSDCPFLSGDLLAFRFAVRGRMLDF